MRSPTCACMAAPSSLVSSSDPLAARGRAKRPGIAGAADGAFGQRVQGLPTLFGPVWRSHARGMTTIDAHVRPDRVTLPDGGEVDLWTYADDERVTVIAWTAPGDL